MNITKKKKMIKVGSLEDLKRRMAIYKELSRNDSQSQSDKIKMSAQKQKNSISKDA